MGPRSKATVDGKCGGDRSQVRLESAPTRRKQGVALTLGGLAIGLGLAAVASRSPNALLYGFRLLARGPGRFPLHLVAEDRAPVPVFGEGHAALDADPDSLLGWFLLPSEQPLQQ
jgi:hypothetical protein